MVKLGKTAKQLINAARQNNGRFIVEHGMYKGDRFGVRVITAANQLLNNGYATIVRRDADHGSERGKPIVVYSRVMQLTEKAQEIG